jgi:ABC-type Na+ efflux pump permease subunit
MNDPEMYLLAFLASMISVFLKTFQTINVQKRMYYLIPPISLMMAVIEVYTVAVQAKHGLSLIVLAFGTGAGAGSCIGIYVHDKMSKGGG